MAFEAVGSTVESGTKEQGLWQVLSEFDPSQVAARFWLSVKAQQQHLLLWVPMFLLAGNWTYFQSASEPSDIVAGAVLSLAILFIVLRRFSISLFLAGVILLGFATAKIRQEMVATFVLRGPTNGVILGGYVADYQTKAKGARQLVIEVEESAGIPEGEQPRRIRIFAEKAAEIVIGDYITFEAYLSPLQRPVEPGGFDYARMLYFQSIGAGGRMLGAPSIEQRVTPMHLTYRRFLRAFRSAISQRITSVIPGPLGHLADAMVSGERAGLPPEMNTSLQTSGLAHIISISGLHMAIVAGGVFWSVRAVLAIFPFFALRFSIKKIAAAAALCVGLFYTLLADSGSATERSFIMIAIMFLAIIVDRPALSLRNLAIAAIVILLLTPEESVGASFQMSFLAVMGMATFWQWWRRRETRNSTPKTSRSMRWFNRSMRFFVVSSLTTLAAGGTSTVAAAYHFDRLSPYSVFANGLTMPITEALVMPPAIIAVLLMPLGLEYYPLKVMEFGLSLTMKVSDWIASWPSANLMVAKPNVAGIVLIAVGAGIVAAGIGRFRWFGVAVAVVGLMLAAAGQRPVILVEDRAAAVAILDSEGRYVVAQGAKNKFVGSKWLQANGEIGTFQDSMARQGWDCTSGDCFSDLAPLSVSYLHEDSGHGAYCPPTEIIIADFPLHQTCRDARLVIDRFDVWRKGTHAVFFDGAHYTLKTARDEQGNRPWAYDSRKAIKG